LPVKPPQAKSSRQLYALSSLPSPIPQLICSQRTVLQNIKEVLELSGSSLEQVVKYNVYLADMKDFAAMNEVYIEFLPKPMPSRSCLQALPPGEGTVIEIECIAQV
jgi:enamine deaminase RidA (YjgF/YER057c/UK114 family)